MFSYQNDIHEVYAEHTLRYSVRDATKQIVRLIESSEEATPPWIKPWRDGPDLGSQRSIRGRPYTGFNQLVTTCHAYRNRYGDNRWLTEAEIAKRGGSVKPGEEPTIIVGAFNASSSGIYPSDGHPRAKVYTVFNADQTIGCVRQRIARGNEPVADPVAAAEEIWLNYENRPPMRNDGRKARYFTKLDYIEMPPPSRFVDTAEYYATLFHEMVHSTGHQSRLDRFDKTDASEQRIIHSYAREELVAELGAALLCAEAGIERTEIEAQHSAYIRSWRTALGSPFHIYRAAGHAQVAVLHILGKNDDAATEIS